MDKLRMYCIHHTDIDKSLREYSNQIFIDTSKLHPTDFHTVLNENLGLKYIYDNYIDCSEYIGCCSYHRIIPVYSIASLSADSCILYETLYGRQNNNSFGLFWWSKEHWYNCRFIYNEWLEYCYDYNLTWALETDLMTAKQKIFYNRSCFVMHRDKFKKLFEYDWNFVTYLNDKYNFDWNTENVINWIVKNYVDTGLSRATRHGVRFRKGYIRLIAYMLEIMTHHFIMYNFKEENIKIMNKIYI